MVICAVESRLCASRTPQGVRGLKSVTEIYDPVLHVSHPARGAWIEIIDCRLNLGEFFVAPRKGCVD